MNLLDSSNGRRTETLEQGVIRLLTVLSEATGPVSSDESWPVEDLEILARLANEGYLSAADIVSEPISMQTVVIRRMRITPEGRAHLSDLKRSADEKGPPGASGRGHKAVYGWLLGVLAAAVAVLVLWPLRHRIFGN